MYDLFALMINSKTSLAKSILHFPFLQFLYANATSENHAL